MSGPVTRVVIDKIRTRIAGWQGDPGMKDLEMMLRDLAKWRSMALAKTFIAYHGAQIAAGPFQGMAYLADSTEGSLFTRLMGAYEACLHPHLAGFLAEGLDCVIDIGCAEGYYAVGLAYANPGLTVHARDISATARAQCAELARLNNVADRVVVGGEFSTEDFEVFAGQRVMALVDIEGAELDLLDPGRAPSLSRMGLIVETHILEEQRTLSTLIDRFSETHHVVRVDRTLGHVVLPEWLQELSELDQLLAHWEWRHRATPWLVMRPRAGLP